MSFLVFCYQNCSDLLWEKVLCLVLNMKYLKQFTFKKYLVLPNLSLRRPMNVFSMRIFFPNRPHFCCSVAQWSQYFYEVAFKYVVKIFLCTQNKSMTFFDLSNIGTLEVILYIFGSKKAFIHIKAAQWLIKYIFYDCLITFWLLNDFTKSAKATDCLTIAWQLDEFR